MGVWSLGAQRTRGRSRKEIHVPQMARRAAGDTSDGRRTNASAPEPTRRFRSIRARARQLMRPTTTPRAKSVLCMAAAIAAHMAGYELARSATLALFTSERTGFGSSSALPAAVGCVGPCSISLLWLYARIFHRRGPRIAICATTFLFTAVLVSSATVLGHNLAVEGTVSSAHRNSTLDKMVPLDVDVGNESKQKITSSRALLFVLFVYQTSSVQLLHTQHWSFIGSVFSPSQGAAWFAPIAGLGSVSSTIAAAGVSHLVDSLGLIGLLHAAGITVLISLMFANWAYDISAKNGFLPSNSPDAPANEGMDAEGSSEDNPTAERSSAQKAFDLFRRVPSLRALFIEVLLCQCLSSLLSFLFMVKAKDSILDDKRRAGWTGNCYAWTNAVSGLLQFCFLPVLMKRIDPRRLWVLMPSVMFIFTVVQSIQSSPSLFLVGATFFAMKTIEYSFRSAAMEMFYVSLDFESRYIGKEVITLFANRFGKSGMAVAIFFLTNIWKESEALQRHLSSLSVAVACLWLYSSHKLLLLIRARYEVGNIC